MSLHRILQTRLLTSKTCNEINIDNFDSHIISMLPVPNSGNQNIYLWQQYLQRNLRSPALSLCAQ
mgnify:FL=1